MTLLLTLLAVSALIQGPADPPRPATISGIVLRSATDTPIAGVAVEARRPGDDDGPGYAISTGADGRFTIKDIPPGEYVLAATHPGYVRGEYLQRGPNGKGLPFRLTPGEELKDAKISLAQTGAIAGRVFDSKGKPFPYVQVQALRFSYRGVQRVLSPARVATTNDLGEYRLFWLPPGQYAVMVMPLRGNVPDPIINTTGSYSVGDSVVPPVGMPSILSENDATLPMFYPGTITPSSATMLTVRSAEDMRGIDLTLTATSTRKVRGTVLNMPAPQPAAAFPVPTRANVRLISRDPAPSVTMASAPLFSSTAVPNATNGAFEVNGVLPGSYFAVAEISVGNNSSATTLFGSVPIEVRESDLDNVSIPLAAGFDVPIRVTIEGRPGNEPDPDLARIQAGLTFTDVSRTIIGPQNPQTGAHLIRSVLPGTYSVYWSQSGTPVGYIKSIKFEGSEVVGRSFRLDGPPSSPIEIVVSPKFATVTGTVLSTTQQPLAGVTVVAIPVIGTRGNYTSATSDAQGRFRVTGLWPADYRILAFEDIENFAWVNRDFMRPYENQGRQVHVEEGGAETVQVIAIPAGR